MTQTDGQKLIYPIMPPLKYVTLKFLPKYYKTIGMYKQKNTPPPYIYILVFIPQPP